MTTIDRLRKLQQSLASLKSAVRAEAGPRISKQTITKAAEQVGQDWFGGLRGSLEATALDKKVIERYSDDFTRLVKISAPNNRKSSYESVLESLTKKFRAELILPLQTTSSPLAEASSFDQMFTALGSSEEDAYLKEAIACARSKYFRAAAVLGWCAAVDRMHKTVEKVGFTNFNGVSASMTAQQHGRFKRFNKTQNVTSLSELRLVFDSDLLWILEGMQLIDVNQHTRLFSCFELRNHSGHPGEAPVTEYNLLSFFSDLIEIVLKNPKFQ